MSLHITLSKKSIDTFPVSNSNEITKEYYNFLVGEINRGTIYKCVCYIEDKRFNKISYHLLSSI
jgi:hypothetical protein